MASRRRRSKALSAIGCGVLCATAGEETASGLKWQQCCVEGKFLGHSKFTEIDWTPELFDTIIANLHKHPGFRAGPDGVGCARVIPWDYEHANEIRRMKGDVPPEGLPSASWGLDLRRGVTDDGKASLEILTEWLPVAKQQVANGEYQYCSVCVLPKFIDPVTGVDQGPTLTSVALTNEPFVQGMEPLAATLEQYGPAESALEVLVGVRSALELPEDATAQQVVEQLHALLDAIANDTVPEYVEEGWILDRIRRLLKLPLLATPVEILGGAEAAINQLPTDGAGSHALTPTASQTENEPMAASILTSLALLLNCQESEPAILQATKVAAQKAATVEQATEATDAVSKLKTMFGTADMESTLAAATKAIADAETLKPTVEALAAALANLKKGANDDAEAESKAIAASMAAAANNPDLETRLFPAILQARSSCIVEKKTGSIVTGIEVDAAKLEKFRADYPLPEEQRALLTRRVVAGPNGTQLGGAVTGYQTQPITQSAGRAGAPPAQGSAVQKIVDAINASPGRNPVERADALLCSRDPQHKSKDFAERCRVAGDFARTVLSGNVPAGFTL